MIDKNDIKRLEEIFVLKGHCAKNINRQREDIVALKKDIAIITTKLNMLIGILGAIAVPVLAIAAKLLFE